MPRVLVVCERDPDYVQLNEQVRAIHLDDPHSAEQLGERLVWAIHDAEDVDARLAEFGEGF